MTLSAITHTMNSAAPPPEDKPISARLAPDEGAAREEEFFEQHEMLQLLDEVVPVLADHGYSLTSAMPKSEPIMDEVEKVDDLFVLADHGFKTLPQALGDDILRKKLVTFHGTFRTGRFTSK